MPARFVAPAAALLAGALLTSRPTVQASSQSDSTAVAAVVERYQESLNTGDTATAMRLLANDALILESGDVETRAEYRAQHLTADIAFARGVSSDRRSVRVVVRGDVAWSVRTSTSRGTFRGRAINSQGVELMILSRENGDWKIDAIHWSSHSLNPPR
jgi:ketosteroid isomerase-like protein